MKTIEAIALLEGALATAAAQGTKTLDVSGVQLYVSKLREWHHNDTEIGADDDGDARIEKYRAELTAWVQQHEQAHEAAMEMFRSTIQSGQNALRTCLLVNGGAAVALLAFIGHLASNPDADVSIAPIAKSMAPYVVGVLAAGLASGFTYLAPFFFSGERQLPGHVFNVAAIVSGLGSLSLFGYGSHLAYSYFTSL